jgi:hypothetical protein
MMTAIAKEIKKVSNVPNANKLLNSLRFLNYKNEEAICDIVDNSLDADAANVWIVFDKMSGTSLEWISISDDGKGMNEETLCEAMKLGSDTEKNPLYDLGRFGMGLTTASISLGRLLSVTTRSEDITFTAIQDLDEIAKTNKFEVSIQESEGISLMSNGTKVTIGKLDNIEYTNIKPFADHLKEILGETFRRFINEGKKIFVNGEEVKSVNPLDDNGSEILFDGDIDMDDSKIHLRIADLKANNLSGEGVGLLKQGFYVIRNNRQIMHGVTLDLYSRHPSLNRMRIEVDYNGELDEKAFKTGFRKNDANLTQSAKDKIRAVFEPIKKQILKRQKEDEKKNVANDIDFSPIEKFVTSKSHLLEKLKSSKLKTDTIKAEKTKKSEIAKTKEGSIDVKHIKTHYVVRTMSGSKLGPIYEPAQEGAVVVLYLNIDNPFYGEIQRMHRDDMDSFNSIMKLFYCFAKAELMYSEKNLDVIEQIRAKVAQEMVILLNTNR